MNRVLALLLMLGPASLSCNFASTPEGGIRQGDGDGGVECPDAGVERSCLTVTESSHRFEGTTSATRPGVFRLKAASGQMLSGGFAIDSSGNYSVELPLFCDEQTLELSWPGPECFSGSVITVDRQHCTPPDLQVTLIWDDQGVDFELHLVRPGGRINDNATDCTWTSCIDVSPDWGLAGVSLDDPRKDVDNTGFYGPESIYLYGPEDGVYHVLVEHWRAGAPTADGVVTITLLGAAPVVVPISDLPPRFVRTVAQIDWAPRSVTPLTTVVDCTANWSAGCLLPIP